MFACSIIGELGFSRGETGNVDEPSSIGRDRNPARTRVVDREKVRPRPRLYQAGSMDHDVGSRNQSGKGPDILQVTNYDLRRINAKHRGRRWVSGQYTNSPVRGLQLADQSSSKKPRRPC